MATVQQFPMMHLFLEGTYFLGQCNSKYTVKISSESVEIYFINVTSQLENCSFEINAFKVLSSRKS